MEIQRMRTIAECVELVKQSDPGTAVTYNLIKQLAVAGKVKSVKSGTKILVNYDDLLVQIFGKEIAN